MLSPYELERQQRIAANNKKLAELGITRCRDEMAAANILFMKSSNKPRPAQAPRPSGPRRTSTRVQGAAEGDLAELPDDFEETKTRNGGTRRRRVTNGGEYTGPIRLTYPPVVLEDGTILERRRACHVCTQGEKSWRGDFPEPLWCTTCPLLYCHRCLFHISGCQDEEEAHEFIAQNQDTWMCFVCMDQCACQDFDLRRRFERPLDRHKARGWAGVTGGFSTAEGAPAPRASTRSVVRTRRQKTDKPKAEEEAKGAEEEEEGPQETESVAAEADGEGAGDDDAASPPLAAATSPSGGAEAAAVVTETETGAETAGGGPLESLTLDVSADVEEGNTRQAGVLTPAKGAERATAPEAVDDAGSPHSASGDGDGASPQAAAAGKPAAAQPLQAAADKPRAAKRLAVASPTAPAPVPAGGEGSREGERKESLWTSVAPGSGGELVGKEVWAFYNHHGWCRGQIIRWRCATNEHTLLFGKMPDGKTDDTEDVIFDGTDDTLLWGEEQPTEKPASMSKKKAAKKQRTK